MKPPARFWLPILVLALPAMAQIRLEPEQTVQARLEADRPAVYALKLAKGDYIEVVAEQPEVDIDLALLAASGKVLERVNFASVGALELVIYLADEDADYRLVVRTAAGRSGNYALRWQVRRPATAQDQTVAQADSRFRTLVTANSPDSITEVMNLAQQFRQLGIANRSAEAYSRAGLLYRGQRQFELAVKAHEQALAIWHETKNRGGEAATLNFLGIASSGLREYQKAATYYDQALTIRREIGDRESQGAILDNLGIAYRALSQYQKAIDYFEQSLESRREWKNRAGEATALNNLAETYRSLKENSKAIGYFEDLLVLRRELKDAAGEGTTLNNLGVAYRAEDRTDKAIAYYEQALEIERTNKNRGGEGTTLNNLGLAYHAQDQNEKAIGYYEQALAARREIGDKAGEAASLSNLAAAYRALNQYDKTIAYYRQALAVQRERKDRAGEATALKSLAAAYRTQQNFDEAAANFEQALTIDRELKNSALESATLINLARIYISVSEYEKAIGYLQQSIELRHRDGNHAGESSPLLNLGRAYNALTQYQKAVGYFEQALDLARHEKNRTTEGTTLNDLGLTYRFLGQYDKALEYYEQSLAIAREVKNRSNEGATLDNLGSVYQRLGQTQDATEYFEQALAIDRQTRNRVGESAVLNNLGLIYRAQQPQRAIDYYEQALVIERELKQRNGEATTLGNLASAYNALGQRDKAIVYYQDALAIAREVKDRAAEANTLGSLMVAYKSQNQPRLAIFYGKQGVNAVEGIRADIRGLDQDAQKSFLNDKRGLYRLLADLLVSQGRLPEAQQVLNLLKNQEFLEYVQRDTRSATPSGRADLTTDEAEWAQRYAQVGEVLVAKGVEMDQLRTRIRTQPNMADDPVIQKQLAELEKDLQAGNGAFQRYLGDLKQHFTAKADGAPSIDLREVEALKADLSELKHGSVAIYTLISDDRYRAILVTPRVQRAYESPVKEGELNRKILAFREATQNPRSDPKALAQELYNIMIPPALAKDLEQAQAQTLMWSLDGALRYVPVAALYDGQKYLIEKYRVTVFTPASQARLKDAPQTVWRGVAFGAAHAKGFPALPSVPQELAGIIREQPGEPGELEGHRLLDEQFTRQSLDRELLKGYAVVHMASHFNFKPGDESSSFLLMGDGGQLSLADLKTADTIFAGVDLLTLSACSTGLGDIAKSDGSEVESFGVLAQRKGAKAVVASLWPVADQSTALLMREFYHARESNPTLTKVDALREAQVKLLRGELTAASASATRSLIQPEADAAAPKDYRHPYFWAPFFLMGNWL